ncbi:uncharacterized protein LOC126579738 [Anopheles aquasalis]|uniref:uncharacterized protein LOC126579738 n=1 Tax=Anopheles aquasalis TaxID=42839 RepID=UPI00215A6B97|nr:uncharacterized protein LOC126579738 [Anopheles aquasalis]
MLVKRSKPQAAGLFAPTTATTAGLSAMNDGRVHTTVPQGHRNARLDVPTFHRSSKSRRQDGGGTRTWTKSLARWPKDWYQALSHGTTIVIHDMLVAVVLSMAVLAVRAKSLDTKQSMALLSPEQRMWSNPCGYPSPFDITLSTPENEVDLSKMRDQMNMSLGTVEVSIKNYTKTIFGVPLDRHHTTWESREEPWIYKDGLRIPKKFRNDIVDTIYMRISYMTIQEATRDFYRLLKDSYRRYIRLARGIEKMKEDLENVHNRAKYKRFELELLNEVREEVRQSLQQVLCEIFEVLVVIDKQFLFQALKEEHSIDINDSFLDEGERKLRDWTIYRELINQLEYIIQYMKALEQRRTISAGHQQQQHQQQ